MKKNSNLKNANKRSLIIILVVILVICITNYCTYNLTYQKMYDKANIQKSGFNGTYLVKNSKVQEYISILNNMEDSSEGTYVNYDESRNLMVTGTYDNTKKNYITLYNSKKDVFATILYLNENFYLNIDGKQFIEIKKISNDAITP